MRDLKFRIWNGAEMIYNVTVGKFGAFYVNPSNNGLDPKDSASLTPFTTKYHEDTPVMQFTGLTDKEGREIYECDILRHESGCIQKVEWGHHLWAFIPFDRRPNTDYQGPRFPDQFMIIGNIYENPELLKK